MTNQQIYGRPDLVRSAEWLFQHTIADLEARSSQTERDRYTLLGIAPLLRKLIMDGSSLVHVIERVRPGVPVGFRIRPYEDDSHLSKPPYKLLVGFTQETELPDVDPIPLKRFLKTPIGIVDGESWNVGQMIRHYSLVEGGVHFGHPRDAQSERLAAMIPMVEPAADRWFAALAYVGRATMDALTPLRDEIRAHPTALVSPFVFVTSQDVLTGDPDRTVEIITPSGAQ